MKLYAVIDDADAEANDLIRVVDESGEDYVYPSHMFQRLNLPAEVQQALRPGLLAHTALDYWYAQ